MYSVQKQNSSITEVLRASDLLTEFPLAYIASLAFKVSVRTPLGLKEDNVKKKNLKKVSIVEGA